MAVEAPKFKPLQFPGVPTELDYRFCRGMNIVYRWKGSLTPSIMTESNLDHMRGMLELLDEVIEKYPAITSNMDIGAVRKMIYVHDMGELITGDLVLSRPDYEQVKTDWKKREEKGTHRLINKYLKKYPPLAGEVVHYYNRYTHYDRNDKEAIFTHLLDKVQPVRFGLKYVYSSEHSWGRSERHASQGLDKFFLFANSLRAIMSSKERKGLSSFVQEEIDNFFDSLKREARLRWESEDETP